MTLRRKTLLLLGGTSVLIFVVLVSLLALVVNRGFKRVENHSVMLDITRAQQAIHRETERVAEVNYEHASWNATYQFIEGAISPEAYLDESGLANVDTYTKIDVELALLLDTAGQPAAGRTITQVMQGGEEVNTFVADENNAISQELLRYIGENQDLLQDQSAPETEGMNGLVLLPETPMILSSRPILTSQDEGPSNGTSIMAVRLDEHRIGMFAEDIQLDIELQRMDEPLPAPFEQAYQRIVDRAADGERPIDIEPAHLADGCGDENSTECVSGYSLLRDVNGDPALLMRVTSPRAAVQEGRRTIWFFGGALIGVGVLFIVLTLTILDRFVLVRIEDLSRGVAQIGQRGSLDERLSVTGSDELASLTSTINRMLQDLQDSQNREEELQIQVQELRVEIDQVRQEKQVKEITDSEFFTDLQNKADTMRRRRRDD